MNSAAVIMMLISIIVIWGGLTAAIINIARSSRPSGAADFRRDL